MSREDLVAALNGDLAHELSAIIQYVQYSAMVRGPWRTELRAFFQAEVPDEQLHAQYLADKIAAMGGGPTTVPAPVRPARTAEEMLTAVRDEERDAVARYTQRVREAESLGEIALKVQLENFIMDEQGHMQECEQILADWR
ncbi:MAG: ferritin-like domain-containing protein [Armatimonadetes bacterium]|nr:ferritin-like domain-containing protein [Armatimonadota bacterium]